MTYQTGTHFDYTNQAWIVNGRYVRCGHVDAMNCGCFGKLHEGEPVRSDASCVCDKPQDDTPKYVTYEIVGGVRYGVPFPIRVF